MSVAAELLDKGYDPDVVRDFAKHGVDMAQALTFAELASVLDDVLQRVLLQFFLSNFCTIFPQYGLPVSSRNCTI